MSSLDDYARVNAPLPAVPKGFEPEVVVADGAGAAKNIPAPENADDRKLLIEAGLDPDAYEITGGRKHRRWQMMGQWQFYWAFNFAPRQSDTSDERRSDVEALAAMFKKKPAPYKAAVSGEDAFVLVAADFQVGKASEHTVEQWRSGIQAAKKRIKDLRKMGYAMPTGAIVGLGDLVEGCDNHYSIQTFSVDLDRRGQVKVARRMLREAIDELAPLFSDFLVTGVAGNHGENRKDGKAFTTMADNDDVALLEMIHEAVQGRPGYEHVRFAIPNDELATCVEIGGVAIGLTHGHLLRSGGKLPQNKALEWWKGQMMGLRPVSKAQILLTGHYHHLLVSTFGPRTHIQAPALDGGSGWWEDMTGLASPDGILTFRIDKDHPLGWDDLKVLGG